MKYQQQLLRLRAAGAASAAAAAAAASAAHHEQLTRQLSLAANFRRTHNHNHDNQDQDDEVVVAAVDEVDHIAESQRRQQFDDDVMCDGDEADGDDQDDDDQDDQEEQDEEEGEEIVDADGGTDKLHNPNKLHHYQAQQHDASQLDKNKKLFPQKLWELIHDQRYQHCLRWSADGRRVYLNRNEFELHYLKTPTNQFHTQKAISFVRQMNMYGFRKVDDSYYENDNFKRHKQHLLRNMIRRHPNKGLFVGLVTGTSAGNVGVGLGLGDQHAAAAAFAAQHQLQAAAAAAQQAMQHHHHNQMVHHFDQQHQHHHNQQRQQQLATNNYLGTAMSTQQQHFAPGSKHAAAAMAAASHQAALASLAQHLQRNSAATAASHSTSVQFQLQQHQQAHAVVSQQHQSHNQHQPKKSRLLAAAATATADQDSASMHSSIDEGGGATSPNIDNQQLKQQAFSSQHSKLLATAGFGQLDNQHQSQLGAGTSANATSAALHQSLVRSLLQLKHQHHQQQQHLDPQSHYQHQQLLVSLAKFGPQVAHQHRNHQHRNHQQHHHHHHHQQNHHQQQQLQLQQVNNNYDHHHQAQHHLNSVSPTERSNSPPSESSSPPSSSSTERNTQFSYARLYDDAAPSAADADAADCSTALDLAKTAPVSFVAQQQQQQDNSSDTKKLQENNNSNDHEDEDDHKNLDKPKKRKRIDDKDHEDHVDGKHQRLANIKSEQCLGEQSPDSANPSTSSGASTSSSTRSCANDDDEDDDTTAVEQLGVEFVAEICTRANLELDAGATSQVATYLTNFVRMLLDEATAADTSRRTSTTSEAIKVVKATSVALALKSMPIKLSVASIKEEEKMPPLASPVTATIANVDGAATITKGT